MTEYDNRNRGLLFKVEAAPGKALHPNAPAYSGPFTGPNNEEWEVVLRTTDKNGKPYRDKDGKPFMTVQVKEKWKKTEGQQRPEPRATEPVLDDDIPFS